MASNAVTFTRTTPGVMNETDGTFSAPTVTTISGNAVQVRGNPEVYQRLSLVLSQAPTLFFIPTTYGLLANTASMVRPGDTVAWVGENFTVRDVECIAPDGVVVAARIIVSQ